MSDDARASAGYLVWMKGKARVLVDTGGGVFLRFGQAKARIEDLKLIAITHLHADHVADLPALVKSGYFSPRVSELHLYGPDGNDLMPGMKAFVKDLFDPDAGAFRYLSGALDGSDGLFPLGVTELSTKPGTVSPVFHDQDINIDSLGVRHGPIPALAYRVRTSEKPSYSAVT